MTLNKTIKKKILKDYLRRGAKLIVEENLVFPLGRLGNIKVIKYKPKRRSINWKLTNQYGKLIHHHNLSTDGYSFKFLWTKCRYIRNFNKYTYKPPSGKNHAKAGEFEKSVQDYGKYGLARWIKQNPHYDAEVY